MNGVQWYNSWRDYTHHIYIIYIDITIKYETYYIFFHLFVYSYLYIIL